MGIQLAVAPSSAGGFNARWWFDLLMDEFDDHPDEAIFMAPLESLQFWPQVRLVVYARQRQ